jgi:hypothetical protein
MMLFLQVLRGCEAAGVQSTLAEITVLLAQLAGEGDLIMVSRVQYQLLRDKLAALQLEIADVLQNLQTLTDTVNDL